VPYVPGLDGIRALAVLAVMAYHGGVSLLPGGFFGVDAFFVLSGFLITTLLVTESSAIGRIRLRAFWGRRARRLVPALLLMLVFVGLYARFVAPAGTYPGLRWDTIATLLYSANWRFVADGQSYAAQTGPVTPLLHMWSLAIEEQFYIVWPVVVFVVARLWRGKPGRALRVLLALSVAGAVASALDMALQFSPAADPTRVYFGTDTHAQCLLVGTALAAALALWRRRAGSAAVSPRRVVLIAGAGTIGAGVCAWAWSQLQFGQTLVFRGGFLIVSVSVAAVITSVVLHPTGVLARVLSIGPLRFVGRISYGMYLWHFPLDIALDAARTGVHGTPLFLVRTAVTVAVSTVSYYALERPVRRAARPALTRARLAGPIAAAGAAVVVALSMLPAPAAGAALPATAPSSGSGPGAGVPADVAHAPVRVLLLGDSVALTLGVGVADAARGDDITLEDLGILGCGVALGTTLWTDVDGQEQQTAVAPPCQSVPTSGFVPWTEAWPSWLAAVRPNVVVLLAGRWEVMDRLYRGRQADILDPDFAAYVRQMLERAVAVGTSTGARMVLMTAPCFSSGEQLDGAPFPADDPRRVAAYNRLVDQVGAEHPGTVTVQDLDAMACPGGRFTSTLHGVELRTPDGIHFDTAPGTGAALLAPQILPLWETLGHEQEAAGGAVRTGPLPARLSLP
jgi:peptidoglycan/LPS O-acetylase OafA/YrhL